MKEFNLAILYWFYKEPQVTQDHLKLIRKNNPNCKIYGLFGGDQKEAAKYERLLGNLLDDFWAYPETYGKDRRVKWIHGDLMILDWYDKHGRKLKWDSIAILQWDVLLFTNIKDIVPGIKKDQAFFSGYHKLDKTIEKKWYWTSSRHPYHKDYEDFRDYIKQAYSYTNPLTCCLYVLEILTRTFFDEYLKLPNKKIGMLEYKDPTICNISGIDVYKYDVGVYWGVYWYNKIKIRKAPMNANAQPIKKSYIDKELRKQNGWRMFHPYIKIWD